MTTVHTSESINGVGNKRLGTYSDLNVFDEWQSIDFTKEVGFPLTYIQIKNKSVATVLFDFGNTSFPSELNAGESQIIQQNNIQRIRFKTNKAYTTSTIDILCAYQIKPSKKYRQIDEPFEVSSEQLNQ